MLGEYYVVIMARRLRTIIIGQSSGAFFGVEFNNSSSKIPSNSTKIEDTHPLPDYRET